MEIDLQLEQNEDLNMEAYEDSLKKSILEPDTVVDTGNM